MSVKRWASARSRRCCRPCARRCRRMPGIAARWISPACCASNTRCTCCSPPRWPAEIFGAVDAAKGGRGKELFEQRCKECHGPYVATAARSAGELAAQTLARTRVAHRSHPARSHRHRSRGGHGFPGTQLRSVGHGSHERRSAGGTASDLHAHHRCATCDSACARSSGCEPKRARPTGDLPAALAAYPDPDATAEAVLPRRNEGEIDAALSASIPVPAIDDFKRPADPPVCALDCHVANLYWDLRHGAQGHRTHAGKARRDQLTEGIALNLVGILVKNRFYADNGVDYATQQCLEGFGTLDLPQEIAGYKPRPLEGVWATAPFLHNGSVPTLYQMLLPPGEARHEVLRRPPRIRSGARGLRDEAGRRRRRRRLLARHQHSRQPQHGPCIRGGRGDVEQASRGSQGESLAATASSGPSSPTKQRFDIIEYLKVHRDLPETPADYQPPQCRLRGEIL